jgi:Sec-independent protein translocase protein TatA
MPISFNKTTQLVKYNKLREYMKDHRDLHGIEAMAKRKPMHFKKHFPWGVDYAAGTFGVAVGKFKKELRDELVTAKETKPIIDLTLTSEDEDGELDDSDNELIPANEAQEEDTSGSPEVSVDDLLSASSNDSLLVSDQQHDETTNRIDAFGGEDLPVAAGPESSILQAVSVFVCKCLIGVFSMLLFFFLFQYFELGPIGQETRLEETFLVVKECRDEMDSIQLKYHDNQDLVALLQYQLEEENAHSWYYELQIQQMKSEQEGLEEAARVSVFVCRCLIRVFSMLLFFFLTALKISIDSFALTDDEKEVALKRTYDRRSGTGRGKEIEKGGGGGRNWGSDKIEARTNEGPVDESAPVGETTTTESEAVVEESVAVDVEEITMPKEKTD